MKRFRGNQALKTVYHENSETRQKSRNYFPKSKSSRLAAKKKKLKLNIFTKDFARFLHEFQCEFGKKLRIMSF